MAAANLGIYLTLQAEGCSLELWNTHKGPLKQDFCRIVQEVKAQRRAEQEKRDQSGQQHTGEEPLPVATGGNHSSNEDRGDQRATSESTATSQRPVQVLKYVTI